MIFGTQVGVAPGTLTMQLGDVPGQLTYTQNGPQALCPPDPVWNYFPDPFRPYTYWGGSAAASSEQCPQPQPQVVQPICVWPPGMEPQPPARPPSTTPATPERPPSVFQPAPPPERPPSVFQPAPGTPPMPPPVVLQPGPPSSTPVMPAPSPFNPRIPPSSTPTPSPFSPRLSGTAYYNPYADPVRFSGLRGLSLRGVLGEVGPFGLTWSGFLGVMALALAGGVGLGWLSKRR